ncbi:MAG: hypothetical protein IKH18_03130 [Clostridia bacterium]|nr:hypothetical protein [Clostridia bacterium]
MDAGRFFSRKRIPFGVREAPFLAVSAPNIDEFLFLPVAMGCWRQHELWDGTYTLDDLLDITEMLRVRLENEHRACEKL